ncbi:MAG: signal peptidase I [Clostridia bacterium]|nr:signal peptidase I [Clostridia bacterium]
MSNYQDEQNHSMEEHPTNNAPAQDMVDFEKTETEGTSKINSDPHTSLHSQKKRSVATELLDYLEIFVFAIGFVIILFSFVFRICTVDGDSMKNTLFEGESLIVSNLFYEPECGDVIVFHQTGTLNEPVVKRVIAVAGETVHLAYTNHSMTVTVTDQNGVNRVLEEPYVLYEEPLLYRSPATMTVPEGSVFVMGDNRNNSMDSRNPGIGMVDTRRILGKVILRLTPFSRMGSVT